MLRSVYQQLLTDVSCQPIGLIFIFTLEDGADTLPPKCPQLITNLRLRNVSEERIPQLQLGAEV